MLADNHAFINLIAGHNEQCATGFEVEESIGHSRSGAVRNDAAGVAGREVAAPGFVAIQIGIHDAGALGVRHEFILVADKAA